MRRADRLFQIVQHFRGGRLVTAQKLGQWLEVSERTIYRDIADLQQLPVQLVGSLVDDRLAQLERVAERRLARAEVRERERVLPVADGDDAGVPDLLQRAGELAGVRIQALLPEGRERYTQRGEHRAGRA